MKFSTGKLRKILAAIVGAPLVVGLTTSLPAPYGPGVGAILTLVGIYVNWGHAKPVPTDPQTQGNP